MADSMKIGTILARRQENLAAAARRLSDIFAEFPELEASLRELYAKADEAKEAARNNGHRRLTPAQLRHNVMFGGDASLTNLQRVVKVFANNGNKQISTPDLPEKSGLDAATVSNVLWSPKAQTLFEKSDHANSKKIKVWRLNAAGLQFAKENELEEKSNE